MLVLPVCRLGHPILRQKAKAVPRRQIVSAPVQRLITDMFQTMARFQGIGLAAPQVGRLFSLCVFGLPLPSGRVPLCRQTRVLINPRVKAIGRKRIGSWEGCLSIPGIRGQAVRYAKILVTGYNQAGARMRFTATGLPAIVIQHETDHLRGLLFLDRVRDRRRLAYNEEYVRFHLPRPRKKHPAK